MELLRVIGDILYYVYVLLKWGALPLAAGLLAMAFWHTAYNFPHGVRRAVPYAVAAFGLLGVWAVITFVKSYVGDWQSVGRPF